MSAKIVHLFDRLLVRLSANPLVALTEQLLVYRLLEIRARPRSTETPPMTTGMHYLQSVRYSSHIQIQIMNVVHHRATCTEKLYVHTSKSQLPGCTHVSHVRVY